MTLKLHVFQVSIVASFVALCIATNYALIGVWNVKPMDLIVFIGGFCFGPIAGASIGIITWGVYGVVNPYGFVPQVWLATMISESIYGLVGGVLRKIFTPTHLNGQRIRLSVFFATLGFTLTLIYDLITNVVYALSFSVPIVVGIISGVPFTVLHEVSNALIFGFGSIPLITVLEKLSRGVGFGISAK